VTWHLPPWAQQSKTDSSEDWHGSCVSSQAAGLKSGVAKESRLLMLKSSQNLRDIFWAFSQARDSFRESRQEGRSVILFTAAARNTGESLSYWIRVKEIMRELFEADAVIVVPAGNYAQEEGRRQIDTIPARWSSLDFPLIVVGAVNSLRFPATFTQGPKNVTVYAPGVDVICANKPEASGMSYAAALVSRQIN